MFLLKNAEILILVGKSAELYPQNMLDLTRKWVWATDVLKVEEILVVALLYFFAFLLSGHEDDSKKIEASATHAEKIIHAAAAADRNGGVAGLFIDTAMVS